MHTQFCLCPWIFLSLPLEVDGSLASGSYGFGGQKFHLHKAEDLLSEDSGSSPEVQSRLQLVRDPRDTQRHLVGEDRGPVATGCNPLAPPLEPTCGSP